MKSLLGLIAVVAVVATTPVDPASINWDEVAKSCEEIRMTVVDTFTYIVQEAMQANPEVGHELETLINTYKITFVENTGMESLKKHIKEHTLTIELATTYFKALKDACTELKTKVGQVIDKLPETNAQNIRNRLEMSSNEMRIIGQRMRELLHAADHQ